LFVADGAIDVGQAVVVAEFDVFKPIRCYVASLISQHFGLFGKRIVVRDNYSAFASRDLFVWVKGENSGVAEIAAATIRSAVAPSFAVRTSIP
jgi:hypothetical protein